MQQAASVPAPGEAAGDPLALGRSVRFTKTAGESDVYLFAGVSGDLGPNHVDEEYMRKARCGRRIAHGVLLIGSDHDRHQDRGRVRRRTQPAFVCPNAAPCFW